MALTAERNPLFGSMAALVAAAAIVTAACAGDTSAVSPTPAPTAIILTTSSAPPATSSGRTEVVKVAPTPADHGPLASAEVQSTPTPTLGVGPVGNPTPVPLPPTPVPVIPIATQAPTPPPPPPPPPSKAGQRTIVLDPGHGGPEVGSASAGYGEKTANLEIAVRLQQMLQEQGFRIVLTRDGDRRAYSQPIAANDRTAENRSDLQARVDIANAAGGDVFIAIHNNGSGDPGQSGTEVWVDPTRPYGNLSVALAQEVLASLVAEIRAAGYPTVNRGLKDASNFRVFNGNMFPIFVLGKPRSSPTPTRASNMPAVLGETLFLSNPYDAQALQQEHIREAIARGYRDGLLRYFARLDAGEFGQR